MNAVTQLDIVKDALDNVLANQMAERASQLELSMRIKRMETRLCRLMMASGLDEAGNPVEKQDADKKP